MRKSSKLLALLLTLCLLFGAITAILVSADEGTTPTLNVGDLQGNGSGKTMPATGNFNRNQPLTKDYELANIKYVTVDVDFNVVNSGATASALRFEPSGATLTYDEETEKTTTGNVSIPGHAVYIIEKNGSFYMSFTSGDANPDERAKISNKSGLYDHFTYVMSIDSSTKGIYKFTAAFYVNGVFIDESNTTEIEKDNLYFYRFATKGTWGTASYDERNIIFNFFNKTDSAKTAALEKALENRAPLYTFEGYNNELGVVYNSTYVTPDAATNYVKVNGTPYSFVGMAMDEISKLEGDNNKITVSGRNLSVTLPDTVKKIEVTLENGADFDAGESFVKETTTEEGVYIYNRVVPMPGGDYSKSDSTTSLTGNSNRTHLETYQAYYDLKTLQYITFDANINFVDGDATTASKDLRFDPSIYINSASASFGGAVYVVEKDGSIYLSFTNNDSAPNENAKISNTAGEYTRFTYVLEIDNSVSGEIWMSASFYVNGTFIARGRSTRFTYTDGQQDWLFRFATKAAGTGDTAKKNWGGMTYNQQSGGFDYYTTGSDNAKALADYLADNMGAPETYVQIGNDKYTTVADINAALATVTNDAEIVISCMDLSGVTLPESVTKVTVTLTNGADFDAGEDFTKKETEVAGVYTYERVVSYATIDGDPTEYSDVNEALNKLVNGGTITLNNINAENFNTELNSFTVKKVNGTETFTLAADCAWRYAKIGDTYKRVIDGDTMANLDLFSNGMRFKLYIPYTEGLAFSHGDDKYLIDGGTFMYDSNNDGVKEKYIVVYWAVRHDIYYKSYSPVFTYTEGDNTVPLEGTKEVDFNAIKYATRVAELYPCGSSEAQLVRAVIDYKIAFKKAYESEEYVNTTAETAFYAIYAGHTNCTCGSVNELLQPEDADLPAGQKYINVGAAQNNGHAGDVTFGISTDGRNLYVYVKVDKTIEANDAVGGVKVYYTDVNGDERYVVGKLNSENLASIGTMDAANLDNLLTIVYCSVETVTEVVDGEEVSTDVYTDLEGENFTFTYALADYSTTDADFMELAMALRNYAMAAENYKKDPATTTTTPEAGE